MLGAQQKQSLQGKAGDFLLVFQVPEKICTTKKNKTLLQGPRSWCQLLQISPLKWQKGSLELSSRQAMFSHTGQGTLQTKHPSLLLAAKLLSLHLILNTRLNLSPFLGMSRVLM